MKANTKLKQDAILHENHCSQKTAFSKEELIDCGNGDLFGIGNAQLPLPPLLMLDRITHIDEDGGSYSKGVIHAELDINPFLWFFKSHFKGDPVMPGCLCTEALWQLTGFFLGWKGYQGKGRVLDGGNTRFQQEIGPDNATLHYEIHLKRIFSRNDVIAVADGHITLGNQSVCRAKNIKIGLFNEKRF